MKRLPAVVMLSLSLLIGAICSSREALAMQETAKTNLSSELQTRRDSVFALMKNGSIEYLISEQPRVRSNDVLYEYRQNNNLYYLTGINQPGIALLLVKTHGGSMQQFLFIPVPQPNREMWTGKMLTATEAEAISGITPTLRRGIFDEWIPTLLTNHTDGKKIDGIVEQLRTIKSDYEIDQLQQAVTVTEIALRTAIGMVRPGIWEYELESLIEFRFKWNNALVGFPSIVASGINATTLHYEENQKQLEDGDLLLMDVGAEVNHYSADITRTIPVNGRFTPEQRALYEAVLEAQKKAELLLRPGVTPRELQESILRHLTASLYTLGLVTSNDFTGLGQASRWFPHGFGHPIGLDVHDVGMNNNQPLQSGMVITIEPGLYIREDTFKQLPSEIQEQVRQAFETYRDIGIRIEDDYFITGSGFIRLSSGIPREPDAIEQMIR